MASVFTTPLKLSLLIVCKSSSMYTLCKSSSMYTLCKSSSMYTLCKSSSMYSFCLGTEVPRRSAGFIRGMPLVARAIK